MAEHGKIYAVSGKSLEKILQENVIRQAIGDLTVLEMRDVEAMVVVDPPEANVDGTLQLKASVIPEGSTVSWTSSASSKATVSNKGLVTAVAAGTAVISASITVNGSTYKDVCNVTVPSYTITKASATNGTVSTSPASSAIAGKEVTITATPSEGYEVDTISVMAGTTAVTVTNNKFTMPAANVTVTVTFKAEGGDS